MKRCFVLTLALGMMLGGCAKLRKARECKALVTTINRAAVRLREDRPTQNADLAAVVKDARDLARGYQSLADQLRALNVRSPELEPAARDYAEMAGRAATATREIATALERMDAPAAERHRTLFTRVSKVEDQLVDRIDAVCGR
jgi:hypothetical protein